MADISSSLVKDLREKTGLGMMQCKKALEETSGDIEKAIEHLRKQGANVAAKRMGRETKEGKILFAGNKTSTIAVEVNCETDFVTASADFSTFASQIAQLVLTEKPADMASLKTKNLGGKTVEQANTDIIAKIGENIGIRRFVIENHGANEACSTYLHGGGKIGVIVKLSATNALENSAAIEELGKDIAMQIAATSPLAITPAGLDPVLVEKEKEIAREQTLKEGKPANVVEKIVEGRISKFYKDVCLVQQQYVKDSKITVQNHLDAVAKELKIDGLTVAAFHRLQLGQ